MKKVSTKQQKINRQLKKVYKEISETRGHYCTGCGRSGIGLSHSHIIPRSRRPDLQLEPDNITYHCLIGPNDTKGCHQMWESTDRVKLLDYHKNMEYILSVDTEYYFLIND
tara:strand:+ start:736 stop:1068 length:333 start_codon:yes stop_codon:yes gene_type:complete